MCANFTQKVHEYYHYSGVHQEAGGHQVMILGEGDSTTVPVTNISYLLTVMSSLSRPV
jgi:hypothetical protein